MIFGVIIKAEKHGSDLLVWVELRGFEPLTPSMRTRVKTRQGRARQSGGGAVQPARADALPR
jgi:hypothetical protein